MSGGEEALYVYALAEPGLPRRLRLQGHSLRLLSVGSVDVVTGPPAARPGLTTRALQAQHELIASLAKRAPALLPARFGACVTEDQVRTVVGRHQKELVEALQMVRGRDQMTIRIFGEPDQPAAGMLPRDTSGAAFLRARRDLLQRLPPEAAIVRGQLGALTAAERLQRGEGRLRMAVFHLVDRAAVPEYSRRASLLQEKLQPHLVRVTGPWPAFAFAPELF